MKRVLLALVLLAGCDGAESKKADLVKFVYPEVAIADAFVESGIAAFPSLIEANQYSPPEPPVAPPPAAQAPAQPVPLPKAGGEIILQRIGDAIDGAAAQPPTYMNQDWEALLFTASWCNPCHEEVRHVDEVEQRISTPVKVLEVDTNPEAAKRAATYNVTTYPQWIIIRPDKKFYRHNGLNSYLSIKEVPAPTPVKSYGGVLNPKVIVADLLPMIAGKTYNLGDKATVSVPADVRWTSATKNGVTTISFSRKPTVTVHRILDWKLSLEGVEITSTTVVLQLDNFPDVTVDVDWSLP